MPVDSLDHYTLRTAELDATRNFFVDVLGLTEGYRPPFSFPGHWLYCGDKPIVHLIGSSREMCSPSPDTGALDHVALAASDIGGFRSHLEGMGVAYDERKVPELNVRQLFVVDPNNVKVELNFPLEAD